MTTGAAEGRVETIGATPEVKASLKTIFRQGKGKSIQTTIEDVIPIILTSDTLK